MARMANRVLPLSGCAPARSSALFGPQLAYLSFYRRCLGFTAWLLARNKNPNREADVAAVRQHLSSSAAFFFQELAEKELVHYSFEGFEDAADWKGSVV